MTIGRDSSHTNKEKEHDTYLKLSSYIDSLKVEDRRIFCKAVMRKLTELKRQEREKGTKTPAGVA